MKNGATEYHVIIPKDDGLLDINASIEQLRKASGIFIGGGQTSRYLELYASEPIRSIIQERVNAGVPFAGMSAGARMASRRCCLFPTPKAPEQAFTMAQGLGLVNDLIVEVHFDENPKGLEYLLEGMSRTQIPRGLGIGAASCAVLRNGRLEYALGDCVSEVTMTDFETRSYEIV
jgi:cyanophycinase